MSQLSNQVNGSMTITEANVELQGPLLDPKYTDDAAVQLVMQDAQRAATFLDQKQWNLYWRESDVLYQAPRTNSQFENSTVARANVSRFTVAKHVNSLVPAMKSGIFYEQPPFLIRPRPSTTQTTARAKTVLYGALSDECGLERISERALENQVTFGTVIVKPGWRRDVKKKKIRRPRTAPIRKSLPFGGELVVHTRESDEIVKVDAEVIEEGMTLEVRELGSVLIDPTWKDPNNLHKSAKYVIYIEYPTFKDLDALREQKIFDDKGNQIGGYDIPPEEELKAYFFSHEQNAGAPTQVMENQGGQNWAIHHAQSPDELASADPLLRPIKMYERWDPTYVYTVICPDGGDRGVLIRKEEHDLPFIPAFAANFWNIPNAGYGIGVGRLAGSDQRIEKGLIDALLDMLSLAVNQTYIRDRGANIPTQQIRQRLGGIIDADIGPNKSAKDVFGIIEPPRPPAEIFPVLQNAATDAESTTGADQAFTQGSLPGKGSSAARTATGAGGIIAANAAKIQGPVGHFVQGILLPFVELTEYFVKDRMSPSQIREILGKELGLAFDLDAENFYQAEDKFECLAGAHLAAKKAMAQALPLMVQIFENQPLVQQLNAMGYMVDVKELLEMFMEVSEWKNARTLIRPMTPQEQQRYQQNNPGLQRVQGQIAAIGARHDAKSQEIDQKAEADLSRDMLSKANEEAALFDQRKWARDNINESVFSPEGV